MNLPILRCLDGSATPEERALVARWRAESEANEKRFRQLEEVWRLLGDGRRASGPTAMPDSAVLIRQADRSVLGFLGAVAGPRGRNWKWAAAAVAATAMVAVGRVLPKSEPSTFGAEEFVTGTTEPSTVILRDGSVVRLAPGARLRITGRGNRREVMLEGRSFFAIAHDPRHPFRVRTPAGDVQVVGTRFELEAQKDELRVKVVEGEVRVAAGGVEKAVRAGDMGGIVREAPLVVTRIIDRPDRSEWLGNFLAFQSTPLAQAAREISERFGIRIEVADPSLAARTVTASFTDRGVDEVVEIVCAVVGAECRRDGGVVNVRPRNTAHRGRGD